MNAELLEKATWAARQNAADHDYGQIAEAVARVVLEVCAEIAGTAKTLKAALPTGENGEFEFEHATIHGDEIERRIRALLD